jgi:FkbM family methyltransferase
MKLFVDVGAFLGDWTVPLALAAPNLQILAVEPVASSVTVLRLMTRTLVKGNRVEIHSVGAGAAPGHATVRVRMVDGAPATMGASFVAGLQGPTQNVVVPVDTVDRLLNGRQADMIKVDVEGFEEEVLQGMRECLKRRTPLIIELWHGEGQQRERRDRVLRWLSEYGYDAFLLNAHGHLRVADGLALARAQCDHPLYCNYVFLGRAGEVARMTN